MLYLLFYIFNFQSLLGYCFIMWINFKMASWLVRNKKKAFYMNTFWTCQIQCYILQTWQNKVDMRLQIILIHSTRLDIIYTHKNIFYFFFLIHLKTHILFKNLVNVASFFGLSIFDFPSVFSNAYLVIGVILRLCRHNTCTFEERIYIGLSCYPILFSTFLNIIRLN